MSAPESISEAESAVLAVLWEKGTATAEDVVAALAIAWAVSFPTRC